MALQRDYDAVKAALAAMLQHDIDARVPRRFRGLIPKEMVPLLAEEGAKVAVDALDAERAKQQTERDH